MLLLTVQPLLKWRSINLGGNGIPGWVLHQEMGSQIRIELPMNWYEDDHFLGFGFFCLHHLGCQENLPTRCGSIDGLESI